MEAWPAELRLLVRVMLSSEFPMMIVWGDEYTQLYNDAFRPILGTGKHPGAMGRSARETWAEIWDEIGPLFASVFAGDAVWNADQRLLINRNGYDEETFFTYSYSPIYDDADVVAGLLVVATETTAQVVDRRRLSSIGDLASALVGATSIESVAEVTIDALRDSVPATAVEIDVVLADSVVRIASLRPSPRRSDRSCPHPRRGELRVPIVLDDDWEPGRPASRVAFAIDHPNLQTVVVVATNPHRPFDEDYQQFVELVRETVSASMTAALLRADELGALRRISDTLQHAMLELASDLPTVAARYLPKASNLTVGGDWYDVLDLGQGRRGLIVGDCVGHGLEAATAMGALRNVSRALLADGHRPGRGDRVAGPVRDDHPAAECATVVCAVVDLPNQTITYSNAGHPPPLLVHDDQAIWLDQALATPLAVDEPTRPEAQLDVHPDDLLVLYTDGLVERRNENLDEGLLRLADVAVAARDEPVQDVADRLIADARRHDSGRRRRTRRQADPLAPDVTRSRRAGRLLESSEQREPADQTHDAEQSELHDLLGREVLTQRSLVRGVDGEMVGGELERKPDCDDLGGGHQRRMIRSDLGDELLGETCLDRGGMPSRHAHGAARGLRRGQAHELRHPRPEVVVESKRRVGVVVPAEVIRGVRHESNEVPQAGPRGRLVLRSQICRQILDGYQGHEFIHDSEPLSHASRHTHDARSGAPVRQFSRCVPPPVVSRQLLASGTVRGARGLECGIFRHFLRAWRPCERKPLEGNNSRSEFDSRGRIGKADLGRPLPAGVDVPRVRAVFLTGRFIRGDDNHVEFAGWDIGWVHGAGEHVTPSIFCEPPMLGVGKAAAAEERPDEPVEEPAEEPGDELDEPL